MPFPWSVRFSIKLIERSACPEAGAIANMEFPLVQINRHCVWRIGLELHSMCTRPSGSRYDRQGPFERLVVVAGHLGHNKRRLASADFSICNGNHTFASVVLFCSEIFTSANRLSTLRLARVISKRKLPTLINA